MNSCKEIERLIDEADRPDLLSFEVTGHLSHCVNCKSFAGERAALRELLAAGKRVSVPANFDAVLGERLAARKARSVFSWASPALYLRLGAATAGLLVMIFAAEYSNLFSSSQQAPPPPSGIAQTAPPATAPPAPMPPPSLSNGPAVDRHQQPTTPAPVRYPHYASVNRGRSVAPSAVPQNYLSAEAGGVILVRGQNGEREVSVPGVSVGAQPLVYGSVGRQQPVRTIGTSF